MVPNAAFVFAPPEVQKPPTAWQFRFNVVFGLLGFLMRRFDYPIAPVVVGLILGPVAENQLRRALSISSARERTGTDG